MSRWIGAISAHSSIASVAMHIVETPDIRVQETLTVDQLKPLAEAGNIDAQYRLGKALFNSARGDHTRTAEAIAWHRKAAEQGHRNACLNLCVIYETGIGVERNSGEATAWRNRAKSSFTPIIV